MWVGVADPLPESGQGLPHPRSLPLAWPRTLLPNFLPLPLSGSPALKLQIQQRGPVRLTQAWPQLGQKAEARAGRGTSLLLVPHSWLGGGREKNLAFLLSILQGLGESRPSLLSASSLAGGEAESEQS